MSKPHKIGRCSEQRRKDERLTARCPDLDAPLRAARAWGEARGSGSSGVPLKMLWLLFEVADRTCQIKRRGGG